MRKLLRLFFPPFVAFVIFSFIAKTISFSLDNSGIASQSPFYDLIYFYRHIGPLLLAVAFLTQIVIIVPVWNSVADRSQGAKIIALITLVLICLGASAGVSYIIWDPQDGISWYISKTLSMTLIQLAYWLIDLVLLLVLHKQANKIKVEPNDV